MSDGSPPENLVLLSSSCQTSGSADEWVRRRTMGGGDVVTEAEGQVRINRSQLSTGSATRQPDVLTR